MPDKPAYPVADLRAFLEGVWRLDRSISDYRSGKTARFEGRALFEPSNRGLCYSETGKVFLDDSSFAASRSYLFVFPEDRFAEVRFDDGNLFHDLDLSGGAWSAEHFCSPDRYRGAFNAESREAWSSRWRIQGPRKDQEISTGYRRLLE